MCQHCMNRREFHARTTAGLTAGVLGLSAFVAADAGELEPWDPDRPARRTGRPLRVQPILAHAVVSPREKTSWRSWSEIVNEPAALDEMRRIEVELRTMANRADFPLEILPLARVTTASQAAALQQNAFDVVLLYAASNAPLFHACFAADPRRDTVVFVRHASGPTYYGYECLGVRHLKTPSPEWCHENSAEHHGGATLDDLVVDDYDEVLWRLRALHGLSNFVGQRIIALGGPGGKWDASAPDVARQRYQWDIVEVSYEDLAARLQAATERRAAPATMRGLDGAVPGPAGHATGDGQGIRTPRLFAVPGLSPVVARLRRSSHHDQPVHGHHPVRVEHHSLHAAQLAERRRVSGVLRVGFRGGAARRLAAPHLGKARGHA
jgi:hypothetical protein